MIGDLSKCVAEQRAVYVAEGRVERAEQDLFACVKDKHREKAARLRYQAALQEWHHAVTRLEKLKCDLAGRRHLTLVRRNNNS